MSVVSADLLQLSIVEEATPGVTPPTPAWKLVPVTSSNLTINASNQPSNLLNPNRSLADTFLTNLESSGDLPIELGHTDSVKLLIESALASAFSDPLAGPPTPPSGAPGVADEYADVGITKKTFTAEVRYPDPDNPGNYLYTWYAGLSVNTWTVEADPDNPVTSTFNLLGAQATTGTTEVVGSTYNNLDGYEVYRGPDFITLDFGVIGVGTLPCLNGLTLTHDNQLRPQRCLGSLYNKDILLGQMNPSGSGSHYFGGFEFLAALIAQTEFKLTVELKTANDQYMAIEYFRNKVTANVVANSGTNTDVMDELEWQSLYHVTEGTPFRVWLED